MNDNLTYLAESKVRFSDTTRQSGAEVSIAASVLRAIGVKPNEDIIVWYLDRDTNQIVPKKKES